MIFEDTTVKITVSKGRLLYCFKADTTEEFDRRMQQLANEMGIEIERELYKKLYKRGKNNDQS